MRMARKKRWNVLEEKRIKEEIELQAYLNGLILADKEQQLANLREDVKNKVIPNDSEEGEAAEAEVRSMEQLINTTFEERLQSCNDLFMQVDDRRKVGCTDGVRSSIFVLKPFLCRNAKCPTTSAGRSASRSWPTR